MSRGTVFKKQIYNLDVLILQNGKTFVNLDDSKQYTVENCVQNTNKNFKFLYFLSVSSNESLLLTDGSVGSSRPRA